MRQGTLVSLGLLSAVFGLIQQAVAQPGPVSADRAILWSEENPLPRSSDLPVLQGVRFSVIKRYEPDRDGYRFLHGVALAFHRGRLYASFAHNQGDENTSTEVARFCVSDDQGRTWSEVRTLAAGIGTETAVSHGVFHTHAGQLWAFLGAYSGTRQKVHTRAFVLDDATGTWLARGMIIDGGFWPMQQPLKMADGNWIMSGFRAGEGNPAAVAISRGDDLTTWDLVVIPQAREIDRMWGESSVLLHGQQVLNIARYGSQATALLARSGDFGKSWSPSTLSNLPMAGSKPYTGTLSTGQHYLICSTSADGGHRRFPLTIAVTRPGERVFSKVFVIRQALFPEGPGESHEQAALAYPYAIEHEGDLYVGYSNDGGKVGRVGTRAQTANNNSAELAVIPVSELAVE